MGGQRRVKTRVADSGGQNLPVQISSLRRNGIEVAERNWLLKPLYKSAVRTLMKRWHSTAEYLLHTAGNE